MSHHAIDKPSRSVFLFQPIANSSCRDSGSSGYQIYASLLPHRLNVFNSPPFLGKTSLAASRNLFAAFFKVEPDSARVV